AASALPLAAMPFPPAKAKRIEAAVDSFMSSSATPGVAVAVVESGRLTWARGFGKSDLEDGAPVTEHTRFRLGAISKSLTAPRASQLGGRGQPDPDAPVQKYCPPSPRKPWPMSTRQLLGHLAGIRHYPEGPEGEAERANKRHFEDPIAAGLG